MTQLFSLLRANYLSQISEAFGSLRHEEDLVDVTLSCEGRKLKAHKVLLSACSSYFRDVFKDNPCQHPVIIFRNVKYEDLKSIIDFIYQGEVSVLHEQLESFLSTANMLEIKGLSEKDNGDNVQTTENNLEDIEIMEQQTNEASINRVSISSLTSPNHSHSAKRRKLNIEEHEDERQRSTEIVEVKEDIEEDPLYIAEEEELNLSDLSEPATSSHSVHKERGGDTDTYRNINFSTECMRKINLICHTVKKIEANIEELKRVNQVDEQDEVLDILNHDMFPLKTCSEVDELENKIESEPETFITCVKKLRGLGGTGVQQVVINLLRQVLSNSVAEKYSLLGFREKKPLKHLQIYKLIVAVTRFHHQEVTENEICDIISRWLVQAKCRRERQEMKLAKVSF